MTTPPKPVLDTAARALLDEIAANPGAVLRLGVLAPGGHGKTTLLREVERALAQNGADVTAVDDAHLLGDDELRALRALVERGDTSVVVAYRPWPRSRALAALAESLGRVRPAHLPAPLTREQVRHALPPSTGRALVDFVHQQTGGVPRFVARLSGLTSPELTPDVIASFRADLDWLDPDAQKFLLAAEAGAALRLDLLRSLLGGDADRVADVIDAARATGLLAPDGTLLPVARTAVAALSRTDRRIAVRRALAESQLRAGGPVLDLVRPLLTAPGPELSELFKAAAAEALPSDPALAARLLAAIGTPTPEVAVRHATASAMAGDLDSALRLADRVVAAGDQTHRGAAAEVAAIALAHRGQLARSTELHRWSPSATSTAFAHIGQIGVGALPAAPLPPAPPTLLGGAASLMAHGVLESVTGSPTTALSTLVRASGLLEPAGAGVLLPDSPAALAALVALHSGEPVVAESALDRAVASGLGGSLMAVRHRLLRAWIAMGRGNLERARETITALRRANRPLEPRDWIFAVALEIGIARRNSDLPTLKRTWEQACEAVLRHPVDLYTFLPLGEFAAAAARLRDQHRLAPHLAAAEDLLRGLGNPALWAVPLHWSGLHAAVIAEEIPAAEEHAAALAAHRDSGRYCAIVSSAAESWLDVLAGKVDPDQVERAARGLHAAGQWWDAARLAGQAAIRTSDRQAMVRLLDCARLLQGRPLGGRKPVEPETGQETGKLSDREREVAELVVGGLTYKQVGDRLFISAKTVEHHVARIRQRLGCTSRAELLDQLRQIVG
ncbi:helix-turn-helix transcriptional regulator [Actinosynnema pretiosum subsp. pretiosum]|uniref:Transcriptional regulator, LuxR family n=2 Tax=Actinosynnema TaxID=40566 RepID=C6WJ94_ACTMD|nr:helix-turn-helix transcriptional regulator [Actinosynnema mirum]ACU34526.1 transcriptional regulator, LuxR family [Actinosynnema mirum DSM 43827]QUF01424.1 helix-turn-helix transcriptional regulator [Actinosynnema pretiosum subsp. pretiosum]